MTLNNITLEIKEITTNNMEENHQKSKTPHTKRQKIPIADEKNKIKNISPSDNLTQIQKEEIFQKTIRILKLKM